MNLPALSRRSSPTADRTRDGDLYRTMHPRLAAIDLLREKCVDGRAGLDTYDESIFILDALPHEIVWARTCIVLCGVLMGERQLERGRVRYRGILEADVRVELGLDEKPHRYVVTDEPLASRAVDAAPDDAILRLVHPQLHLVENTTTNVDETLPLLPALERARHAAALRVDCGCGAPAGMECRCTDQERMTSALKNRALVDDERQPSKEVH